MGIANTGGETNVCLRVVNASNSRACDRRVPFIFFGELREGPSNLRFFGDKPAEIIAQTQEAPDFLHTGGYWPVTQFISFSHVNADAIFVDDMPQILDLMSKKGALVFIFIQVVVS